MTWLSARLAKGRQIKPASITGKNADEGLGRIFHIRKYGAL
jgi:hypothetical protein